MSDRSAISNGLCAAETASGKRLRDWHSTTQERVDRPLVGWCVRGDCDLNGIAAKLHRIGAVAVRVDLVEVRLADTLAAMIAKVRFSTDGNEYAHLMRDWFVEL